VSGFGTTIWAWRAIAEVDLKGNLTQADVVLGGTALGRPLHQRRILSRR
jgi:hypothetical protein